jgi:multidrug efflux pump subunit AcrB
MRIWIDPGRAAALNLTAGEIVAALRAQNVQVSSGALGQPPNHGDAFQLGVEMQGRLTEPQQFADIVIRTDADGHQVRVRDVARVERAQDYNINTYLSNKPTVVIAVMQRPGSNALAAAARMKAEMDKISKTFPKGMEYSVIYNPTEFISQSIDAVYHTLFEAVVLVVLVILVFLPELARGDHSRHSGPRLGIGGGDAGGWAIRSTTSRSSDWCWPSASWWMTPSSWSKTWNATSRTACRRWMPRVFPMDEVATALVAIVLVLCAVFVPTLFITGLSGAFYKQFAVTISTATVISLILADAVACRCRPPAAQAWRVADA